MTLNRDVSVVVVGGGFAGVACAKQLAKHDVQVTLIDRHDYNQFQPLLYQVATAQVETSTSRGRCGRCSQSVIPCRSRWLISRTSIRSGRR